MYLEKSKKTYNFVWMGVEAIPKENLNLGTLLDLFGRAPLASDSLTENVSLE
jgi:hypothetical protein